MKQVFSLIITVVLLVVFSPDGASQPRKKKDFRGKGDEKVGLVKWSDLRKTKSIPFPSNPRVPARFSRNRVSTIFPPIIFYFGMSQRKMDGWWGSVIQLVKRLPAICPHIINYPGRISSDTGLLFKHMTVMVI